MVCRVAGAKHVGVYAADSPTGCYLIELTSTSLAIVPICSLVLTGLGPDQVGETFQQNVSFALVIILRNFYRFLRVILKSLQ